jgi:hypothetical protein
MSHNPTSAIHPTFLETDDSLMKTIEVLPEDFQQKIISVVGSPNTDEQKPRVLSRNKRAMIEKIITLWVKEHTIKSYGEQENREYA